MRHHGAVLLALFLTRLFAICRLKFNNLNKQADPTPYDTGRHGVGLGNSFLEFPKTAQKISFSAEDVGSISVRTIDGFSMTIDVTIWYKLQKEALYDLYQSFKFTYEGIFVKSARARLRDVAASFTGLEFASEDGRILVERTMREAMAADLLPTYDANGILERGGADLVDFQLKRIYLPARLESQKLNERLIQMDKEITSVQTDLVRITTNTTSMITELRADKSAELGRIQELTNNEQLLVEERRIAIEEETNIQTAKIDSDKTAFLQVFEAATNNLIVSGNRNITVTQRTTEQLASQIDAASDLEAASISEEVARIVAQANADAIRIRDSAKAEAQKIVSTAIKESFAQWVSELGFSAEEINALEWNDAMAAQGGNSKVLDLQKPDIFNLPGQAEQLARNM